MFRLVRWLFSLALLCMAVWFAVMVPLGDKTLWMHLRAIFATKEAHDLARGVDEEAKKVADKVREGLRRDAGTPLRHSRQPLDPVGAEDQKDLDKLVQEKTEKPVIEKAAHTEKTEKPEGSPVEKPAKPEKHTKEKTRRSR
jgi:hypothetical protein